MLFNPKVKTLYTRDDKFKVTSTYSMPEFDLISNWVVTEKVDGMSVLLHYDTALNSTNYFGRTAKTNFNARQDEFLEEAMITSIPSARGIMETFGLKFFDVYAELIGPDIQGKPYQRDEYGLLVFDMRVDDRFWLNNDEVRTNTDLLGFSNVPMLGVHTINEIRTPVIKGYTSELAPVVAEGVVLRTDPLLYTNVGDRVIAKLKHKDF